jgi:hypothetical protein
MTDTPTLAEILDAYLNTNDYDDDLDGWVAVVAVGTDSYRITFTPEQEPSKVTRYWIKAV